jgi:hypothetical protein
MKTSLKTNPIVAFTTTYKQSISQRMKHILLFITLAVCLPVFGQRSIDLGGTWQSTLGEVKLPGSLLTNDKGDLPSLKTKWTGSIYDSSFYYNPYMETYRKSRPVKFPFFLTPCRHFIGRVTYSRTVMVPRNWHGQRISLFLERPHIETLVKINGHIAGHQTSLSTPHVYDVTQWIKAGKENEISIEVYNGIENVGVGQDSHSVTDQTQGNWNGIAGRIALEAHGKHPVGNVRVYPDAENKLIRVVVTPSKGKLSFMLDDKSVRARRINDSTYTIAVEQPKTWSEFSPVCYRLRVSSSDDSKETVFGFRNIQTSGRHLLLNGKEIWIRGTVENCDFPLTGYPPTDRASWLKLFRQYKNYGINAVRFHSYCPPEAAFEAADSLGLYLQPEGPSWPNHGVRLGRGMIIDQYLMDETQRILDAYGNHPSFVMMAACNEPAGDWVKWCNGWVSHWSKADPRRLYCGASVGGGWAWDDGSQYHVKGGGRGLNWSKEAPQSADDYSSDILHPRHFVASDSHPVNDDPVIAHEQGQWCAFPDLSERSQYTGVYKAYNYDIFEDLLRKNGMAHQAHDFLMASGHLQVLAYKYEIERNLRTPDYTGFLLLGLTDYSGQGTAVVGPLNVFGREKGYVNASQWRRFCSEVVPLASFPKMVFTDNDTLTVPVKLYNASGETLQQAQVTYTISLADSAVVASGTLNRGNLPMGKNMNVGVVRQKLNVIGGPAKCRLAVHVLAADGRNWSNDWDFWVYPSKQEPLALPDNNKNDETALLVTDTLDTRALNVLSHGGKVLLQAAGKVRYGNNIKQTYLPVFWNTSWFKMRPPHTTGAVIDPRHPVFRNFPTDDWANLNWWELLNNAQVILLDKLPSDYFSPIQPIDTWHISRKLGMMVEAKVLNGRLLMTTMDISTDLNHRHVARQMRYAILKYMSGPDFNPSISLTPREIRNFFECDSPEVNMFTRQSPDELKPKIK